MTKEQILSKLLSNISNGFDKSVGSFFYDTQKPLSIELETIYTKMAQILLNGFAATAKGAYLESKVSEQGLTRKAATYAVGFVTIAGENGAAVNIGDKVAADRTVFTITENKTLSDGTVTAAVCCDEPGAVGNVPVGAINRFPVTLSGITSVTNAEPTTGGFDIETDDELRERYFQKVSAPLAGGNKYHYMLWAREVAGVGDVKVLPLWNGAGTVKVVLINSDRQAADATLIKNVFDHIEENRPVGAEVTVESAVPLAINVSARAYKRDGYDAPDVKAEMEKAVSDYLRNLAFRHSYVSYAHIGGSILSCGGLLDYDTLTANGGTDNIPIGETEVPVLGGVTLV